jgi:hypothetical protein
VNTGGDLVPRSAPQCTPPRRTTLFSRAFHVTSLRLSIISLVAPAEAGGCRGLRPGAEFEVEH